MNTDALEHLVHWARAEAPNLGLDASHMTISRVLSPGGFGQWTLRAQDKARTVYLKAAGSVEAEALARWAKAGPILASSYHAPPVLGFWPAGTVGPDVAILATEGVAGHPMADASADVVLPSVLACLRRLHRDPVLASALGMAEPLSLQEAFWNTLGHRLTEDLAIVARRVDRLPPSVRARLGVLSAEANDLGRRVKQDPAFDGQTTALVHGDPHWHNILVMKGGRSWHLLDWDDLAVGDPAVDVAVGLFRWGIRHGFDGLRAWLPPDRRDLNLARRIGLYSWASVLDMAIDSLADVVAAEEWVSGRELERARQHFLRLHEDGWTLMSQVKPDDFLFS